jgi:hypothetical protein
MHPNTPPEFTPWPKIPRLNRPVVVTEKIDGTNAAVIVREEDDTVWAQSRKKVITPDADNFGFARWVAENADMLRTMLGYGVHFGEWYGKGIQRGYGLDEKRFMLFNTAVWGPQAKYFHELSNGRVEVSTVLYEGPFDTTVINGSIGYLRRNGSQHVPGWDKPEGVVIFHTAANSLFKVLCEGDELPKGVTGG